MPTFSAQMINLYSRDLARAVAFYSGLDFVEEVEARVMFGPVGTGITGRSVICVTVRSKSPDCAHVARAPRHFRLSSSPE